MKARTHDLAAFTALGIVVMSQPTTTMSLSTVLVALLANQLGGVAPDIDQPTAPLWRNLPIGGVIGRIIDKMLGGHRFVTHSLLGLGLFGFGLWWICTLLQPVVPHIAWQLVWWAFMIGMVSHLIMDTFTKEGVPWLLPLPVKFGFPPTKSLRATTGKAGEVVIFCLILLFDIWYCASHYAAILTLIHERII